MQLKEDDLRQLINNQPIVKNNKNPNSEPSATTEQTKMYVSGGTEADSKIVVRRPVTKYYIYGFVGVVTAFVAYKVFFNKKA